MLRQVLCLVLYGLLLYATFAVSIMGVAIMLIGYRIGAARAAGAVAAFFFAAPLVALGRGFAQLISAALNFVGTLVATLTSFVFANVVDPLLVALGRLLRSILFPRRR